MRNPTTFEKDELLRFFLHHMTSDMRNLLMATYPLHYQMLYPTVAKETLAFKVVGRIDWMADNSQDPIYNPRPSL